jgi:hypothetical protein
MKSFDVKDIKEFLQNNYFSILILAISYEIPKILDEKIKFESDSQVQTSIEPSIPSPSSQIPPIEIKTEDQPNLLLFSDKSDVLTDLNRDRTLSNASSATVDYDFDTETCANLV